MLVCGVDTGSLNSLSYVAWLQEKEFFFDIYIPSHEHPLPSSPVGLSEPSAFAFDCPQGLSPGGNARRRADQEANTPTRRLPNDWGELESWKPYGQLIKCGATVFWAVYDKRLGSIPGLISDRTDASVFETYPNYVLRRLWPNANIPSKRREPFGYVNAFWPKLMELGYRCESVKRPTVDQLDAAICALVAERMATSRTQLAGTVGVAPTVDEIVRVLREGFIISP